MNPQWRKFLLEQQAIIEHDIVVGFDGGSPSDREDTKNILCDLSTRGLISISGADAVSFMQGQFTTNVPDVTPTQAQLSAWCSPKGRVLAVFTLLSHDDGYLLVMPGELIANVTKRLKLYVLRSQVVVEDVTDRELVGIGCQGRKAQTALTAIFGDLSDTLFQVRQSTDGLSLISVPGTHPRYEILGPLEPQKKLWTELSRHLTRQGEAAWSLGAFEAGVPSVSTDTADEYLPQMLNLELIGGVDFNKGCYAGQEIVARTHYLGTVKRRMYLGGVQTSSLPARGASLVDGQTDQRLGKIVDAVYKGDGDYLTLVVVSVDSLETHSVHLDTHGRPEVHLTPFSYMEIPS